MLCDNSRIRPLQNYMVRYVCARSCPAEFDRCRLGVGVVPEEMGLGAPREPESALGSTFDLLRSPPSLHAHWIISLAAAAGSRAPWSV